MHIKAATAFSLAAVAGAVSVIGYSMSLPFRILYEKAVFSGLPVHLHGLKILQITDLHGRHSQRMQRDIWPFILGLDFDMAVICGDVILNNAAQLHPHLKGLRALAEKAPVFYVDGNHERNCYNEIAGLFKSIGIIPLYNRRGNFVVGAAGRGNTPVVSVAGFRDYEYLARNRFKGVSALLADIAARGGFHIILTHQPQIFDMLCKRLRADMSQSMAKRSQIQALVLAGHTHGGQVRLPFLPTLFAPGQGILPKYGDGWYNNEDERLKLFISRGVGATRFPIRMFNPPEVTVIELARGMI